MTWSTSRRQSGSTGPWDPPSRFRAARRPTRCRHRRLGGSAGFVGKVADDPLGEVFIHDIRAAGVAYHPVLDPLAGDLGTGRCLVFVTGDAERTMATHLGAATTITPADLPVSLVARGSLLYLEGYLWDLPPAKDAMRRAIEVSTRTTVPSPSASRTPSASSATAASSSICSPARSTSCSPTRTRSSPSLGLVLRGRPGRRGGDRGPRRPHARCGRVVVSRRTASFTWVRLPSNGGRHDGRVTCSRRLPVRPHPWHGARSLRATREPLRRRGDRPPGSAARSRPGRAGRGGGLPL